MIKLLMTSALKLNDDLSSREPPWSANEGYQSNHCRASSKALRGAITHRRQSRARQVHTNIRDGNHGVIDPPDMFVYYELSENDDGVSREIGYSWEEAKAREKQPNIYKHSLSHNLRQFEMEMMWMLRWMAARWEALREVTPISSKAIRALAKITELETESSTINARSNFDRDPNAHADEVTIDSLDNWKRELQSIEDSYQFQSRRRSEDECRFEEWYMEDEVTEADIELLSQGASAYHAWRIKKQEADLRIAVKQEVETTKRVRLSSHVNLVQMEQDMESDQAEVGRDIEIGDGSKINHKDRVRYWLENRLRDSSSNRTDLTEDCQSPLNIPVLGLKQMTIPAMTRRWAERFKDRYAQGLGRAWENEESARINQEMWAQNLEGKDPDERQRLIDQDKESGMYALPEDHEAWLWGINDFTNWYQEFEYDENQDSASTPRRVIHQTFRELTEDQRILEAEVAEHQQRKGARLNNLFWDWIHEGARSAFDPVSEQVCQHPLYWEWRREESRHLLDLAVVGGELVIRDGTKQEDSATKERRWKEVRTMWEDANDTTDYEMFEEQAKLEIDRLLEEEERAKTAPGDTQQVNELHLSEEVTTLSAEIEKQAKESQRKQEEVKALLDEVHGHQELKMRRSKAEEGFNKLFQTQPKWDLCNQHVEDTLMLMSLMIGDRDKKEGFETEKVLTEEEKERTDWKIIQLESDELAKTEVALAEFHRVHLSELKPDLRPDKYPAELWALTRSEKKQAAHDAWAKFSPERLDEVLPRMMKIDISRETAARRREEPYLRAQILCNIDTWVYPDEDNPPMIEGFEYSINLIDPKVKPFKSKQRRFSILERFSLRARCLNMLERKKIQNSTSEWASPPRLVAYDDRIKKFLEEHKENTMEALQSIGTDRKMRETVQNLYRFTSDMRKVNESTQLEVFPLPSIPDLIDKCHGKDRYTCLDLEDAFFVVRCAPSSRHLTAFLTPDGLFEYLVMVQGGKCSANVFAKIVSEVFHPLQDKSFLWYQDDLVNYEDGNIVMHMDMQEDVHTQCRKYNMILKPSKAHLNFTTQRVLGYIVSKEGRRVDPSLVEAITKLAPPKTLQGIQSLLGLAQVAREYIPAMATVIAPLQALARKNIDIEKLWDPKIHGVAFDNLKAILTSAPVLLIPDVTKRFRVHVDCCKVGRGCGAVLLQENERGEWQPVAYWSRALTSAERKFSATSLEATAMHDAILHWKVYLTGQPFDVVTDHYALVYMITRMGGDMHGRMSRMTTDLQGFTFSVIHRSGSHHLDADAISRLLQVDEEPYVNGADDLRDDFGPLTEEQKHALFGRYPVKSDAITVIDIIEKFRVERLSDPKVDVSPISQTLKQTKAAKATEAKLSKKNSAKSSAGSLNNENSKGEEGEEKEVVVINQKQQLAMQKEEEKSLGMKAIVEMPSAEWAQEVLKVAAINEVSSRRDGDQWISGEHEEIIVAMINVAERRHVEQLIEMVTQDIEEGRLLVGHRLTDKSSVQVYLNSVHSDSEEEEEEEKDEEAAQEQAQVVIPQAIKRSERIRALQEQQSAKKAVEMSVKISKEEDAAMRAIEKTVSREERAQRKREERMGVHDRRLHRENAAAEAQLARLSDFNSLVSRHFVREGILHEIVNTYQDKSRDKFMAMAQKVDDEKKTVTSEEWVRDRVILPILGENGAKALVKQYEEGTSPLCDEESYPKNDREWVKVQSDDADCAKLMEECLKSETKRVTVNKGKMNERIYERRRLPAISEDGDEPVWGPVKRVTILKHGTNAGNVSIQVEIRQTLVPAPYRRRCLMRYHEDLGHPGTKRMVKTMARAYYWNEMKEDTKQYVDDCHYCKARKVNTQRAHPPVQSYSWPIRPFYRMHMDIAELSITISGYRYVLVLKDALTKWIELIALKTKSALEVAEAFVNNVVMRHGSPVTLITDKGSENCNAIMDDVVRLLGCEHISTTPYNPRSDGLAENQMRTLKDYLASWTNKFHNDWDQHLQKVAHAYRITVNDATGFTPFYMNHGRECNTPAEQHFEDMSEEQTTDKLQDYAEELRTTMMAAWELTAARVVKNVETFNRVPRRHLEFHPYEVGSFVFVRVIPKRFFSEGYKKTKHKLSSKLQHRYVGPFKITRIFNEVLYEADIHNKLTRIHAVNMKPA